MNRSDFYYDQEVREAEMDQVFDDVEDMEQAKIVDFDLWGVITGLEVTQQTTPDLTVKVSTGRGHDRNGRRIVATTIENLDLSTYLPTTGAGYSRYVDIYGVDFMEESDPRLDGHSNPLNYRLTEGIDFFYVAGSENTGAPPVPTENMDHLPLARVLLTYGQTQILDSNIEFGYRMEAEIAWRRDRAVQNHLFFTFVPGTHEYSIAQAENVQLAPQQTMGEKGFDANGRSVEDAGFMSMRTGGIGFDMNSNQMTEVGRITCISGGVSGIGLDMNVSDIDNVDEIHFDAGANGYIDGGLTNVVFEPASDGGIDLNGRDIFCTSGVWIGTDCDRLSFHDGLGSTISLGMNDGIIDQAAKLVLSAGTGTGIDTDGKNIITNGGDLDLSVTGTDGDILGVWNITFGNLLSSSVGNISVGNNVSTGGNIYCDADVFADYDGSGLGGFRYGVGGEKTQFLTMSASEAEAEPATWTYQSGGRDNGTLRRPEWTSSGASIYDLVCFPVHLPKGARVISVKGKVYSQSSGSIEMTFVRYDMNIDSSTTGPGDRSTVPNASVKASTTSTNYETLTDTLSSFHVISEDYTYEVVFESYAADVHVYGVEIEYDITTVVAGLH